MDRKMRKNDYGLNKVFGFNFPGGRYQRVQLLRHD